MLLFYFLTCVQKIKSMFQVKAAKFLIRLEIGGSTLDNYCGDHGMWLLANGGLQWATPPC
jgi:hypothetical protein